MFIEGFAIGGYRSFGQLQRIGPCQKVNLMVGANNCGKSNILSFLMGPFRQVAESLRTTGGRQQYTFEETDRHIGDGDMTFAFGLGASHDGAWFTKVVEKVPQVRESIEKLFKSETLTQGTELAWFEYESSGSNQSMQLDSALFNAIRAEAPIPDRQWSRVWNFLLKKNRGDLNTHWIPETMNKLSPIGLEYPEVSFVPAIREISATQSAKPSDDKHDLSGTGLIDRLAQLEKPAFNQQENKKRFERINHFLRSVTDNPSATLEIPYERDMIIVHMDRKTLPLTSLGTGIHEVIILASAATVVENQIVCMEEPEIHLHPLLQRKLVRYLNDETSNQYFVSTHSAHILETEGAAVFRIQLIDGQSRVSPASTTADMWAICRDLGYRASDILQANCIIWVEGPSDRIYLNHWIRAIDSNLIEGIQYSIMFYGGRLLRHLTANDPEVEEFISLRRLNRNIVVVVDSDKESPHKHINDTKKRIRDELNEGPGFAWITKGREIENYVETSVLSQAVEEVRPGMGSKVVNDPYLRALPLINPKSKHSASVDKIKVAREVAKCPAQLDGILDLKNQIQRLVDFVNECNPS